MFKYLTNRIVAGIASCLTLTMPAVTFAAYIPPADQVPPRTRGSTAGRRAPCNTLSASATRDYAGMVALAPVSYMGKTASSHPTFAWFAHDDTPVPVQFSLYEYDPTLNNFKPEPLVQEKLVNNGGINSFKLPKDKSGLVKGKTYAWQVVISCDVQTNAKNRWIRSPIQLAPLSPLLQQKLVGVNVPSQKLNLYAEAGLWYDALDIAITSDRNPSLRPAMRSLISSLAKVEKAREPRELPKEASVSYSLEQIAANKTKSLFR